MRSTVALTRSDDGEYPWSCPLCGEEECGGECEFEEGEPCSICGLPWCGGDCGGCPDCGDIWCNGFCQDWGIGGGDGDNTGDNGGHGEDNTPDNPCPECGASEGGCFCTGIVPVCEKCGKLIGSPIDPCMCDSN